MRVLGLEVFVIYLELIIIARILKIKKNLNFFVLKASSYISGRMEEFFPNPLEFDPERFYSDKHDIKNYTYFPFSLGPRNCIGQNFAMVFLIIFYLFQFLTLLNLKD